MKNKTQGVFILSVAAVLILSLIYIDVLKESIVKSIETCIISIVPSLFFNSVLSSVIIKCSSSLKPKRMSYASYGILLAFLLGNTCGYPIGAKILRELVKDKTITQDQAETAICFSYASGPAYILGVAGSAVFHTRLLSFTAFLSIFLSNTVLFIICIKRHKSEADLNRACNGVSLTMAVMEAINSSANSMISICSSIVFFSALLSLIKMLFSTLNPVVATILEISNVTLLQGNGMLFFVLVTVLLAFGGLCVHMQMICLADSSFSFKRFYMSRIVQLILTAVFSATGYQIVKDHISIETGTNGSIAFSSTGSIIPFVCIAGMILIALTYGNQKSDRI